MAVIVFYRLDPEGVIKKSQSGTVHRGHGDRTGIPVDRGRAQVQRQVVGKSQVGERNASKSRDGQSDFGA